MVVDGGAQVNDVKEGGLVPRASAGFSGNAGTGVGAMGAESGKKRMGWRAGLAPEPSLFESLGFGAEPCGL